MWCAAARSTSVSSFLSVSIARATKVASAPIASESGLNGWSSEPIGVDFVTLPSSRRRRVLALRQPVDLVVEEQDLEVHVPAQRVDQVVAADRQRVAVAGHDPDGQVRTGHGQTGRDRRRAAVDRVHPVGLHVVREARGAADPGHEDDPLALQPELGHEALHGVQDRVVAAARAPAHLLVGLEVLRRQLQSSIAAAVAVAVLAHRFRSFPRLKFPVAFAISSCWPCSSSVGATSRKPLGDLPGERRRAPALPEDLDRAVPAGAVGERPLLQQQPALVGRLLLRPHDSTSAVIASAARTP